MDIPPEPFVLFTDEEYRHQRQCYDSHCRAYRKIYPEADVSDDKISDQQQSHSQCRGNQVMLSDIIAAAYHPAEVGESQRYESDRSADAHRRAHKAHYHEQTQRLTAVAELDFSCEMSGHVLV